MRDLGRGNGAAGVIALGSYTPVNVTCSGTAAALSLTATGSFSPGDAIFIHQTRGTGAGLCEDNQVESYTSGTITLVHPLENTYTDSGVSQAQVMTVAQASATTGTYTMPAWDGDVGGVLRLRVAGKADGTIDASGKGFRGGSAWDGASTATTPKTGGSGESYANTPNQYGGTTGSSPSPDPGTSTTAAMPGRGSRGQDKANSGAGGAHAAAGGNGVAATNTNTPNYGAPTGPVAYGQAELTSLFMGGGGAEGGSGNDDAKWGGFDGANGGGIIYITCGEIAATLTCKSNGADGVVSAQPGQATNQCGGGGGGAGGSILVRAVKGTLGSGLFTAAGGAGGTSAGFGTTSANGGAGSVGRIRIEACSLSGTASPTASTVIGGQSFCSTGIFLL